MADEALAAFGAEALAALPDSGALPEGPVPGSVETPDGNEPGSEAEVSVDAGAPEAPPPAPAPEPPAPQSQAAPPIPRAEDFYAAANKLAGNYRDLHARYDSLVEDEKTDYQATRRLEGRVDAATWAVEVAQYQERRKQRELGVAVLQSRWAQNDALTHELNTEYERAVERQRLEPFARAAAPVFTAEKYAAQWGTGSPFPMREFMKRMSDVPPHAYDEVAQREFAGLKREYALQRKLAGVDHMGGAGGHAGRGGVDYSKASHGEMSKAALDYFYKK